MVVNAQRGDVELGEKVILAHGATVLGPASVGVGGTCPGGGEACPSFVSFNAEVDGAIVEKDAMVLGLARVGPGVRIPSGLRVLPGRSIDSQAEVATETVPVTEADREFMRGVVEVNTEFARGYTDLEGEHESNVHGINENVTLGAWAVFFRSRIGDGSIVGRKSLVQQSDLPAGTIVPPRTVVIGNEVVGFVEW